MFKMLIRIIRETLQLLPEAPYRGEVGANTSELHVIVPVRGA